MKVMTVVLFALLQSASTAASAQSDRYPTMAPLAQYLMPEAQEIELARTAAPPTISGQADVMVLRKDGYVIAAKGTNGFLCLVERGWAGDSKFDDFWNATQRAPICFNPAATETVVPIYLMKTRLALAGKSKKEIVQATTAALDDGKLPSLAPGAMCYMMSKQQYLNDEDKSWRPHMMFFVGGDAARTWGANVKGSPVMAADDPEEHVTIFMIAADHWSDGTPAPAMHH